MLTPQDIQAKEFAKAVFGGYDMSVVDDFLEEVMENYTSLYKENAILKGKLKVLVEKVEEYRSTEDAMRMALLTAQKMSDEMVEESKKKCDDMLEDARKQSDTLKQQFSEDLSHEQMKLEAAKIKTADFVQASRQIIDQYNEFLNKLDSVTQEYGGAQEAPQTVQEEPKRSPEPEPVGASAEPAREVELDETIKEIDSFVADVMDSKAPEAETGGAAAQNTAAQDVDDSPMRRIDWNEEDELTTPRPKFNFDDLKFGTNYSEDK